MVTLHSLGVMDVMFDVLPSEGGIVSKQCDNLRLLLDRLIERCSATRDETRPPDRHFLPTADGVFSNGHFTFTFAAMGNLLGGINADSSGFDTELNEEGRSKVPAAAALFYLESLNGLCSVLAGRQVAGKAADPTLLCLSLSLVELLVVEFVDLVFCH